jgi:hypothetical protein
MAFFAGNAYGAIDLVILAGVGYGAYQGIKYIFSSPKSDEEPLPVSVVDEQQPIPTPPLTPVTPPPQPIPVQSVDPNAQPPVEQAPAMDAPYGFGSSYYQGRGKTKRKQKTLKRVRKNKKTQKRR